MSLPFPQAISIWRPPNIGEPPCLSLTSGGKRNGSWLAPATAQIIGSIYWEVSFFSGSASSACAWSTCRFFATETSSSAPKNSSSAPSTSPPSAASSTTARATNWRCRFSWTLPLLSPAKFPTCPMQSALITRISGGDPRMVLADCRAHKTFCWVARKANADVIERIRALNLQGIHFQKESKRFYPKRELSAQVLGYVGTDDEGLSGIEREYDEQLRGQPGRMQISVDARKKWFARIEKEPEPGDNLVLTVDEKIQYIAERELEQAIKDTQAIAGTVIVENPHTGEILALANRPTFNPNIKREIKNESTEEPRRQRHLRARFDVQAGHHLRRARRKTDAARRTVRLPDGLDRHQRHAHPRQQAARSADRDRCAGRVERRRRRSRSRCASGEDRFYKYIRAFGFGQQTGIELPGETRGMTKPVNRWSKVSIGAISMGQEIGVSAVQLAAMVSTFANDGVWVAPRIVAGTTTAPDHACRPSCITHRTGAGSSPR